MNAIAVIQARMASTRFPAKAMALLQGRPMLEWVIDAAKRIGVEVIVATTRDNIDDVIAKLAKKNGVKTYRDSAKSMYDKYLGILSTYDPEYIMRICGDQPLLDSGLAQVVLSLQPCDYASMSINGKLGVLTEYGISCEVFSADALRRQTGVKHLHGEHCTTAFYLYSHTHMRTFDISLPPFRATVDYREDLRRIENAAIRYGRMPQNCKEAAECLCT